jgi:hypothetical protein
MNSKSGHYLARYFLGSRHRGSGVTLFVDRQQFVIFATNGVDHAGGGL